MIIVITLAAAFILALIVGSKQPQHNHSQQHSNQSELEPIYDDGEIVGWYEE